MCRIERVFENESALLMRLEGPMEPETPSWVLDLDSMVNQPNKHVYIDLSLASFSNESTIQWFLKHLKPNVFLLNSPVTIRHFLQGTTFSRNLLD